MPYPDLEPYFQTLTDITDNIALINTHYEANHDKDFQELEDFFEKLKTIPWEKADNKYFNLFSSYFTFHGKIIEEIIREAREILNPDKRPYLKRLVAYKKAMDEYFTELKKRRKTSAAA